MAEMTPAAAHAHKVQGRPKRSTRVDLTPMVDLGFLLITFFIFTTTMSQPTAMKLNLPADGLPVLLAKSSTLTLLLKEGPALAYYTGDEVSRQRTTGYGADGLRNLLQERRQTLKDPSKLTVLIKPGAQSSYGQLVDVLDEMTIGQVKRYMILEPVPGELME